MTFNISSWIFAWKTDATKMQNNSRMNHSTMLSEQNNNTKLSLEEYSAYKALELLPIDIYTALLILVGLSGNILVIVFFSRHRNRSPTTLLIIAVASVDAMVCFLMPKNFVILLYPYQFTNTYLCKLNIFTNHFISIMSGLLLFVIAIFRYRGICRPFKPPITDTHAYIGIVTGVTYSLVMSIPTLVLYETMPIILTTDNNQTIAGYDCLLTKDESLQSLRLVSFIVNAVTFLATCVGFIVFYWHIAMAIHAHKETRRSLIKDFSKAETSSGISMSEFTRNESTNQQNAMENREDTFTDQRASVANEKKQSRPVSTRAVRQIPMLITITAIHVVSYLPFIVISVLYSMEDGVHDEMNVLDQFCLKSYLITSAINPLVYIFFNKSLRRFVKQKLTCQ